MDDSKMTPQEAELAARQKTAHKIFNHMHDMGVDLKDVDEGDTESRKVATNIPEVDARTHGGLIPGLHTLTAGPGTGKTSLASGHIAYLAALDGRNVTYITDEVGSTELWLRLASRKMEVDRIINGGPAVPCWSELEDVMRRAVAAGDVRTVAAIGDAIYDVKHACKLGDDYGKITKGVYYGGARKGETWTRVNTYRKGKLTIKDMGPRLTSAEVDKAPWVLRDSFNITRYLSSFMAECEEYEAEHQDDSQYWELLEDLDDPELLIIDPVNSLRILKSEFTYSHDSWGWESRDLDMEPRKKMDEIVDALDNWGRRMNVAILAIFHGNMTRGDNQVKVVRHPSMGDFKESSRIEYRAVTAWELVPASKMGWAGHPKPPEREDLTGEPVGLFPLKLRGGERPKPNDCIWLSFDGAHNLMQPYEV